ncbi:MAG: diacylglycerol/polyprenol kinase family protein [Candidatus Methylomirabilia bacterium]
MKHVGRKLYHILGGLGLLAVWFALGRPRAFHAYALILAAVLLFDVARFCLPRFNAWAMANLAGFLRPGEERKLNGTPPYICGVALTLLLFPEPAAVAAVLFLVIGDVSATTVGERWGRHKIGGKSLEGTAAFFAAACLAGFAARAILHGPAPGAIVAGAWCAALVELFLPRFANDNLVVPLAAAFAMTLLTP